MKRNFAELLGQAIAGYRNAIETVQHSQNENFHRGVAADAEWTLAKATGKPCAAPHSAHARATLSAALTDVCREACVLFINTNGKWHSGLQARRLAAKALGLTYSDFVRAQKGGV